MVLSLHQSRRILLPLLCILIISIYRIESFDIARQVRSPPYKIAQQRQHQHQQQPSSSTSVISTCTSQKLIVQSSSFSLIVLDAKKKKKISSSVEEEEEREREQPRGLGLVLLFMTPWRNPNSIFVYMFGILYVLGKYGEMKSSGAL